MNSDRPPSTSSSSSTSDLFICFTSRSMNKLPSKSILSPGRSLTTSLSRRLRTNRSIKGGASPATFPTTGKKRSGGFENNQEPSSPKVTCIGQVRIKRKKKQVKRLRSLSRNLSKRHSSGDGSFRKLDRSRDSRDGFGKSLNLGVNYHVGSSSFGSNNNNNNQERNNNNNQRWVHLPLTICEALRAFGSEFSCLFPCRSSCFSPAPEKVEKNEGDRRRSSCAAVFTRWLVAYDDGGGGGRRDVELVVGDEDEDKDEDDGSFRVARRHVFDDLEIVNDRIQGSIDDEGRLSICIPPKNALLLMRCRSDPLKMEALANRLWQSTVSQSDDDEDEIIEIQQKACNLKEDEDNYQENEAHYEETYIGQSIEVEKQIPEINDENEDESTYFGSLFDEIEDVNVTEDDNQESQTEKVKGFEEELPECLLLMMYEPKLSMEVSKETWVSSKDFIRRQSSRKKPPPLPPSSAVTVKPPAGQSKVSATTTTNFSSAHKHVTAAAGAEVQPGRSSCSLPAPSSMAEMLEQKLVTAVGYEPLVLTRCKSEPMRTAAAKLAPDNCFWKNRKLEPLRRASFGLGAAGIGF